LWRVCRPVICATAAATWNIFWDEDLIHLKVMLFLDYQKFAEPTFGNLDYQNESTAWVDKLNKIDSKKKGIVSDFLNESTVCALRP
jgi:hypothetical protein